MGKFSFSSAESCDFQPEGWFARLNSLSARLYLLFAAVAFEYLYVFGGRGATPNHLQYRGMTTDVYGQIPIFAFVYFLGFSHRRLKTVRGKLPFGRVLFGVHLLFIAIVCWLSVAKRLGVTWLSFDPFGYVKCSIYLLATVLVGFALIPLQGWIAAVRATGRLWLYALLAGVGGWAFGTPIRLLWNATSTSQSGFMQLITLNAVASVLRLFNPDLIVDSATFTIGTPQYMITIAGGCSGIEGLGLVLVFTGFWLWSFRKEIRFPQAFLLIPLALGCSWLLNIFRLCGLILISSAGGSEAALAGFHAQAGWIAFILIAMSFSLAIQRISWLHKLPPVISDSANPANLQVQSAGTAAACQSGLRRESPAIRAYILPFLAILASASVSKLTSAYFDWLYPLRFIVAAILIYLFWPTLKKLDWRFGWFGPVAGAAVFLLWIAPSWFAMLVGHTPEASALGGQLAALSPSARWTWIAFRVAAAILTVPIAEELAFRGFLARRLISLEFDRVSFSSLTLLSIGLSSVVFGVEHMKNLMDWQHLLLGTIAGLAFATALRWRGRIGDAVIAHAFCNFLLAAWVLGRGDWSQW
jgi:exosortase E/protease (VPEID-CTERM system)